MITPSVTALLVLLPLVMWVGSYLLGRHQTRRLYRMRNGIDPLRVDNILVWCWKCQRRIGVATNHDERRRIADMHEFSAHTDGPRPTQPEARA